MGGGPNVVDDVDDVDDVGKGSNEAGGGRVGTSESGSGKPVSANVSGTDRIAVFRGAAAGVSLHAAINGSSPRTATSLIDRNAMLRPVDVARH